MASASSSSLQQPPETSRVRMNGRWFEVAACKKEVAACKKERQPAADGPRSRMHMDDAAAMDSDASESPRPVKRMKLNRAVVKTFEPGQCEWSEDGGGEVTALADASAEIQATATDSIMPKLPALSGLLPIYHKRKVEMQSVPLECRSARLQLPAQFVTPEAPAAATATKAEPSLAADDPAPATFMASSQVASRSFYLMNFESEGERYEGGGGRVYVC
jgi:hypothetical protein